MVRRNLMAAFVPCPETWHGGSSNEHSIHEITRPLLTDDFNVCIAFRNDLMMKIVMVVRIIMMMMMIIIIIIKFVELSARRRAARRKLKQLKGTGNYSDDLDLDDDNEDELGACCLICVTKPIRTCKGKLETF